MSGPSHGLRPYMARHWRALAGAGVATGVSVAATLAAPWPLKLVIDRLFASATPPFTLDGADYRYLAAAAVLLVGITLADAIAGYLSTVCLNQAAERIVHDLRIDTYAHLHRLSLAYHDRSAKGDLVTRVTSDVTEVGRLFSDVIGTIVQSALLLAGMLAVTFLLDPVLALAMVGLVPVLTVITARSRVRVRSLSREQRQEDGDIASLATEALAGVETVKAFGTEGYEHGRVAERSERRRLAAVRTARVEARFGGAVDVVGAAGTALVLVLGVVRVAQGALTPGDLVVFVTYAQRTYKPLKDIVKQITRASRALARAERIAEVLATDETLADAWPAGATDAATGLPARAAGHVEVRGVTFGYGAGRSVLSDVSLEVPQGTRIALVGRSGAGKSTLCSLIARFHDPWAGAITVDGRDVRSLPVAWMRGQVGMLLQDSLLFTGTVAENIAYGTDATMEEVVAAATAAGADDVIRGLPEGYDTMLGHRGIGLSGGQRQRLGIARVLLRDPPILILDEPTTGLDAESESAVLDGLATLMHGRTVIIVTHSGMLARTADRVVVMEGGRVVQDGPPGELMEAAGPFRRMEMERTMAARRRRSAPRDRALPQMRWLLDPGAMTPVLQRSLGPGAPEPRDVRVTYARYRPGRRLTVRLEAEIGGRVRSAVAQVAADRDLRRRAEKPMNLSLARSVNGRSPSATPLVFDPDVEALIQWFPLDLALPGLAEPPELLVQRLGLSAGEPAGGPEILSYTPRRRARLVLGDHVLTAYGSAEAFERASAAAHALGSAGVRTPAVAATIPALRLLVHERADGTHPGPPEALAEAAGALLARLHSSRVGGLAPGGRAERLALASRAARVAAAATPLVGPSAEALVRRLEEAGPAPGEPVAVHGGFHAGTVLVAGDGGLVVVDADRVGMGAPATDLAAFAARVVEGPEDLDRAFGLIDLLCAGYGSRPAGLEWHLAAELAIRMEDPFTSQYDDWPRRTRSMVDAAAAVLSDH